MQSTIFPPQLCYYALTKTFPGKGAPALKKVRLNNIILLVSKYGIGEGAVPLSVYDFVIKVSNDP